MLLVYLSVVIASGKRREGEDDEDEDEVKLRRMAKGEKGSDLDRILTRTRHNRSRNGWGDGQAISFVSTWMVCDVFGARDLLSSFGNFDHRHGRRSKAIE
jgi:hypothetical protein